MAIQLVRQFSFSDGAHNFNMLLKAPVVGIGGYSGTGKTFFFNTVKDLMVVNSPELKGLNVDCLDDVIHPDEAIHRIEALSDTLILIDKADIYFRNMDITGLLAESRNQFIIFTRLPINFNIPDIHIARMKFESNNFSLLYLYPDTE